MSPPASASTFVVFFAMTGAELRVQEFAGFWPVVLGLVLVRGGALGRRLAGWGRSTRAEAPVTRYLWSGRRGGGSVALHLAGSAVKVAVLDR